MEKVLLKPEEAAAALGIARARVFTLIASGELGSVKIGASRRIPASDLAAYVERLRQQHGAETTDASRRPVASVA